MLLPQVVEKHFGIEKGDKLVLVPLDTSKIYEIIKNIALAALCILTLGLLNYLHPELQDHIYYGLFYHKKIIKLSQNPYSLNALMNFGNFKRTLLSLGWHESCETLKALVPQNRLPKLNLDDRVRKMLMLFFLAIKHKYTSKTQPQSIKPIPHLMFNKGLINNIPYSFALSQGKKSAMEDIIHVASCDIQIKNISERISCFILMDGHGIQKSQEPINIYIQKYFFTVLKPYLNAYLREGFNLVGVYEAFKATFLTLNANYPFQKSGTTFLGIFFINNLILCISIGDSKAYLINPFLQLPLTLPADLSEPYFQTKLIKRNVRLLAPKKGGPRVEGILNMASAIGDKHILTQKGQAAIKPSMIFTAIPRIWIQSPASIILGSDGVFDFLSQEELHATITSGKPTENPSEILVETAFANGSHDNLSAVVINI